MTRIQCSQCHATVFPIAVAGVLLGYFCGSMLPAQISTADISGRIVDQHGAVVPRASVTLKSTETDIAQLTVTDGVGLYYLADIKPGSYVLSISKAGFRTINATGLTLYTQDQVSRNFTLEVGSVTESITVSGEAELVSTSAAVGTIVDRQFVENLPLNGRSFQSLIALTPGVVMVAASGNTGQFSVNGQRSAANSFSVDGVSANIAPNTNGAGNLPGLTATGTTQSLASVDALQEFKVQTSTYTAESGTRPGGQISIVTRSGTNQFHGNAFEYFRNNVFDANDWFADRAGTPKPPERQNDFGGTLGGPLWIPHLYNGRNKTFFFVSYEGLRLRLPQFDLSNVPTLALRQNAPAALQPLLNAFPKPNGKDLGNGFAEFTAGFSNPTTLDATSVRIDHTVGSKLSLFTRYSRTPSVSATRAAGFNDAENGTSNFQTQTLTAGATSALTPRAANDVRVNYSSNQTFSSQVLDTFGGATSPARSTLIPSDFDPGVGASGGALFSFSGGTARVPQIIFNDRQVSNQRQFNIVDGFSYHVGSHHLKFGVDYRRLTPNNALLVYNLLASFQTQAQVLAGIAPSATLTAGVPMHPIFTNLSVYAQDNWKLTRRLTLDLGLRWELDPPPTEANGHNALAVDQVTNLATMKLAPYGTKEWQTTYHNFAPRLGMAYQVSQTPGRETVLRGGFGVYFDVGNDLGALNLQQIYPYASNKSIANFIYPYSTPQVTPVAPPINSVPLPTPYGSFTAFDPHLKMPYTLQWNVAVQKSLGKTQALTVSYLGAAARRLLQGTLTTLTPINPLFTSVTVNTNRATSNYNALQGQFQRRLSRGLQALASYTWSHALDDDSVSSSLRAAVHGNAAFDIRQVVSGALTYDLPKPGNQAFINAALGHWSVDTSIHAQTAPPIDVNGAAFVNPFDGSLNYGRPNVILGVPLYVDDPSAPGGRRINRAAFSAQATGTSGNLGRNQLRGLGTWQQDFAVRREFSLRENLKLQFRGEAFNVFNHPNFGAVQVTLSAANFGQATNMLNRQLTGINQLYQIGGPRSLQIAMKLLF